MVGCVTIKFKGGGLKYGSCKSSFHNYVDVVSNGRNH